MFRPFALNSRALGTVVTGIDTCIVNNRSLGTLIFSASPVNIHVYTGLPYYFRNKTFMQFIVRSSLKYF